ncbi:hypothetical protein [Geodermatophilus poikilotrophus]|uniref:Uncharacterized protein n=1 Tax=Geodermatophilus poikilotrophus TaxID=1333667 RepID=A0A1I0IC53_9ACTN|nr:hypothetical protein [Geodermatophilus poikilotrophus]SET94280.1 hypothetical protein SAMN04488546_4331 [Geodermatophilus poikilotrophus]
MPDTAVRPDPTRERQAALTEADRAWRRAGVRARDRATLARELEAELIGAQDDARPVRAVLGEDPAATARQWAEERGLTGRALRLGLLLPIALLGVLAGSTVTLVDLGVGFTTGHGSGHAAVVLTVWATSVVLAVLLAALGCWAALARLGDPRAAGTAGWVAGLLPLGGGVAAVAGAVTAATQHFSVRAETFVAVGVVVLAVLAGTVVLARLLAVRLVRREDPTG